jgi:hypothetical protein
VPLPSVVAAGGWLPVASRPVCTVPCFVLRNLEALEAVDNISELYSAETVVSNYE